MKRFTTLLVFLALLVVLVLPAGAQDQVTIDWFVGLGTGANPEQQEAQLAVVDAFNASQDTITLEIVFVENSEAVQTLATLIATGQSPDIIGPVGFAGTNAFQDNLLDIQPFVDETGYDLSQFPEAAVDFQRTDQGLLGLPLANFPAFLYYRPGLFDEAGLEYPPAAYGEPYILDGEELEWNVDTMSEIAKYLTVDANGFDASEDEFDSENVIQWGYINQWSDPMRQHGTMFGAGSMYETLDDGTYKAVMPESWHTAFDWEYNAVWNEHFVPNFAQVNSDILASDNAFASGNVAMAQSHLWYTCCVEDDEWDAAALPSYEGVVTARLHADTFRILTTSDNQAEAFEVLTYLVGPVSLDLLTVYGGMPAVPEDQPAYFAVLDEKFPQGVNWDVARDGLSYPDIPSHEEWLPNNNVANDRLNNFWNLLYTTPDLDVDAEIEALLADLDVIYNTESE
jgi:multiple sugar transport system substrate-binding protein